MAPHVVLLRGINLVKRNRVAIGVLRAVLESDEFGDVQTYVQSGNVALSSRASPESVAKRVNLLIKKRFGLTSRCSCGHTPNSRRSCAETRFAKVAVNPK